MHRPDINTLFLFGDDMRAKLSNQVGQAKQDIISDGDIRYLPKSANTLKNETGGAGNTTTKVKERYDKAMFSQQGC